MIPFIKFIRDLILSQYHGWVRIQFRGPDGIVHFEKEDSVDIKPFKGGWNEPMPD